VPCTSVTDVPGAIAIVIVLFLIPVVVIMSGAVASAIIGEVFYRDGRKRFEDSELLDLPD
jgi:hypothetical protein